MESGDELNTQTNVKAFKTIAFNTFTSSVPKQLWVWNEDSPDKKQQYKHKSWGIFCKYLEPEEQKKIITQNCNTLLSNHSVKL